MTERSAIEIALQMAAAACELAEIFRNRAGALALLAKHGLPIEPPMIEETMNVCAQARDNVAEYRRTLAGLRQIVQEAEQARELLRLANAPTGRPQ